MYWQNGEFIEVSQEPHVEGSAERFKPWTGAGADDMHAWAAACLDEPWSSSVRIRKESLWTLRGDGHSPGSGSWDHC